MGINDRKERGAEVSELKHYRDLADLKANKPFTWCEWEWAFAVCFRDMAERPHHCKVNVIQWTLQLFEDLTAGDMISAAQGACAYGSRDAVSLEENNLWLEVSA